MEGVRDPLPATLKINKKKGYLAHVCRKKGCSAPEETRYMDGEETSKKGDYCVSSGNHRNVKW